MDRLFPRLLALLCTYLIFTIGFSQTSGVWTAPAALPATAVHTVVLPTGKLMFWNRRGDAYLWDPASGTSTPCAQPPFDAFCAGHVLLGDGTVMVAGGHVYDYFGLANAAIYNPFTDTWKSLPPMAYSRWYPTLSLMPNGKDVFVDSGTISPTIGVATIPEFWTSALGQFTQLTNAAHYPDLYPMLYLSSRGTIFNPGPQIITNEFGTTGSGSILSTLTNPLNLDIAYGSSVVYAPGKAIVAGGGTPVANSELVDFTKSTPTWSTGPSMSIARRQFDLTLLPTGDVLATGGSSGPGFTNSGYPVFVTEVWTPGSSAWRLWAPPTVTGDMASYRGYHSNAVLLPDGRVFSSTGDDGADPNWSNPSYQVFTPPYLTQGTRPTITSAPSAAVYGDTIQVGVSSSAGIASAVLVRLSSQTHCMNTGQIYCPLNITVASNGFTAQLPTDPTYTPPGYYMLFAFDNNGAHSVGQMIRLGADLPAPLNIAVVQNQGVTSVTWNGWSNGGNPVEVFSSNNGQTFSATGIIDGGSVLQVPANLGDYLQIRTNRNGITSAPSAPIRVTSGSTTLTAQIVTGYNEYHTSAKAQLVDENGVGVPWATVQLSIGGITLAQGVTDNQGNVEIGFIENKTMLGQSATLTFAGSAMLTGSTTTVATNFQPEPTTGEVDAATAPAGTTVRLAGRLKIPHFYASCYEQGMPTTFSIDGTVIGTTTTDQYGNAYINYAIPNDGSTSHTIQMSCAGDAYYAAGTATNTLTIGPGRTQIWIQTKKVVSNVPTTIPMTLSYSPGTTFVTGATLAVTVNGNPAGTVTTDSTGWAYFTLNATPGTTSATITATFAGNATGLPSSASNTITVQTDTTAVWTYSTYHGYAGVPVSIQATLKALSANQYLGGQVLSFFANGILFGTAVTDSTGWARLNFTPTAGTATIPLSVSFAGSTGYQASSATSVFNVTPDAGASWISARTAYVGQPVTFSATLRDATKNVYVGGKTLNFTVNGVSIGTAVTDSTGWAYLTTTAPSASGTYAAAVTFAGDPTLTASTYSVNLTVNLDVSSIWVSNKSAYANGFVTVPATVRDTVIPAYLAGQTVTFTLNGVVLGTAVTDSTGWCYFTFRAPATAGTYNVIGTFAGTPTCAAGSGTGVLTVK